MTLRTKKSATLAFAKRSALVLAVMSTMPMHTAMAQSAKADAATQTEAGKLEALIVTAQRRSENVKDIPMSISALKGAELDNLTAGGMDIRFLAGRTGSLNVESDFGRTFPRFYVRGLGNTDFDLNASQPVGLIYDDVVQESPLLKGFPIFDVNQVEVLRGPQGTLFGRNSPAGVVKVESTKPSRTQEGYLNVGIGNYGATNVEGAFNMPLGPDWAARISILDQRRNDRVTNPRPGPTKDFEGFRDSAERLMLQYKNGDFSALLNVNARDYAGNATLFRANIIKKGTNDLVPGFNYDLYPTDGGNVQTLKNAGGSLHLKWDMPGMAVHSITSYETAKFLSRGDVDGGYGASYAAPMGPGFIPFVSETADGMPNHKQVTQEFRVESNTKDALQWIGGLYYFHEDITVESFDYNSLAPGNPQDGYAVQSQQSNSWAGFGSVNYAVTDAFKVRAGIRYTEDKKDFTAQRLVSSIGGGALKPISTSPSANNVSWDLSANYALDKDTNLYARAATGYRAPSIQGRVLFGDTISVAKSENVLSFEGGIKKELFDKRARFSLGVFQYNADDMQLTAGSGAVNQNQLVNAKKVTGQGVEFDMQAILSDNWRMTFGTAFNDTEIKDPNLFVSPCGGGCTVTNPPGKVAGTVLINGNDLPRAPRVTANFTLRFGMPVANGELYAFTDWAYRAEYNMFLYTAPEYRAKALLEGGLRVGYKWDNYEIAAYSRNITNRLQLVGAIDFNNLTGIVNEPRTFGLQFKSSF
jgi:iron complex outermembrane receptor protein